MKQQNYADMHQPSQADQAERRNISVENKLSRDADYYVKGERNMS
jgi:hypothetical protein